MNLKWNAPEVLEYYWRSRSEKNAQVKRALEVCRKKSWFFSLTECHKRNLLRIVAHRIMVVNFLLRHLDESGADKWQRVDLQQDSDTLYELLSAYCGSVNNKQTFNVAGAWNYYCSKRGQWLKDLADDMENVYSRSWSDRMHANYALKIIPDFFRLSAFLLQHADAIPLTPSQYDLLLEDEETCYSYLLGALQVI